MEIVYAENIQEQNGLNGLVRVVHPVKFLVVQYGATKEELQRMAILWNAMAGLTNEQVEGLRGLVKELTEVCEDALNSASEDMYFDMISAIKLKETINKAKEIINEPVEEIPTEPQI